MSQEKLDQASRSVPNGLRPRAIPALIRQQVIVPVNQAGHGQRARQHDGTHAQGQERKSEAAGEIVLDGIGGVHGGRRVDGQEAVDGLGPHDERQRLRQMPAQRGKRVRRHDLFGATVSQSA